MNKKVLTSIAHNTEKKKLGNNLSVAVLIRVLSPQKQNQWDVQLTLGQCRG